MNQETQPIIPPANRPYDSSDEHLWDELSLIDQLVRAQTVFWRLMLGQHKPPHLWGMLSVTEAEIDAYLAAEFSSGDRFGGAVSGPITMHWENAMQIHQVIRSRLKHTQGLLLRVVELRAMFDLSDFDLAVVLTCLLTELDGRYRRLFGYLQDDATRTHPSPELLLQILQPLIDCDIDARARFDNTGNLLRHRLIDIGEREQRGLPTASVQLDSRIVAYLLGNDSIDRRLQGPLAELSDTDAATWNDVFVDGDVVKRMAALAGRWRPGRDCIFFLHGTYGGAQLRAAQSWCAQIKRPLLRADVSVALRTPERWDQLVALVFREARLRQAAIYWANVGQLLQTEIRDPAQRWDVLLEAAAAYDGVTFFESDVAWDASGPLRGRQFQRFEFPMPTFSVRQAMWRKHLPVLAECAADAPPREDWASALANSFDLSEENMLNAVATARGLAAQRDPAAPLVQAVDLHDACRRHSSSRLATLARRVEPRRGLLRSDLILPEDSQRQLDELYVRLRLRNRIYSDIGFERRLTLGKGLIALFTGGSGTGKTMAAELLAIESGLALYKVDLSALVSKYVGETEKNIRAIFSAATDANAILFFDEADAVFGKRGEVKDAQDRWANIEVNYLLQQVEEYCGVVVLASNLRQNIDDAFLRRIHLIVDFPFPDAPARARILRGLLPTGIAAPPDEAIADLAERFQISGGNLKNVVLDASFRALAEAEGANPRMTHRHLVAGIAREYQKLGKPLTKSEFGEQSFDWVSCDILAAGVGEEAGDG